MGKRGNPCSICQHPERVALDSAMAAGTAMSSLARRYGISESALQRHRKRHLSAAMKARLLAGPRLPNVDLEHLKEATGQSWLAHMLAIRQRLFAALALAEERGEVNQIARVISGLHQNAEIMGRHLGELNAGSHTTNILIQPQYLSLRVALVDALADFPDARRAVAETLTKLEQEAAPSITAEASRTLGHDL